MDNIPDDSKEWIKMKRKIDFFAGLRKIKHSKWAPTGLLRNILKFIYRVILTPFSVHWFAQKEEEAILSYYGQKTKRCWAGGKITYLTDKMNSYIEIEFEGNKFMAIKDYHQLFMIH